MKIIELTHGYVAPAEDALGRPRILLAEERGKEIKTTRQVARRFWCSPDTLQYFIDQRWVDAPADSNNWTDDEILKAYFDYRLCVAYRRGWRAAMKGHEIQQYDGSFI